MFNKLSPVITVKMDFEAARRNADTRLNQELIRIRNLPKRSKIKIANKYGLKHASHTNDGLLKELEINLGTISREQKRVVNECNKRQRDFQETQKKSLSKFLPPLEQPEEKATVEAKPVETEGIARQRGTVLDQTPMWLKGRKESVAEIKREMLLNLTARSKEKTFKIISENNKKTSIGAPLPPLHDIDIEENSWITRLNRRRKKAYAGSCFPFLLQREEVNRERESFRGKNLNQKQEWSRPSAPKNDPALNAKTFREVTYEKIIKMPDPAKIPHLDPWNPKLYPVATKVRDRNRRKISQLQQKTDSEVARKATVFTKHWK